jgi:7-cyano-7-deazaguanine synthase
MKNEEAVLLFSGGIDSTTALYWAHTNFKSVTALIFEYSQKHSLEVELAQVLVSKLDVQSRLINLPLKDIVYSPLVDNDKKIPDSMEDSKDENGVPLTYVPFRNGIFLSIAAGYAESRNIFNLITGFNLIDTPDYPDTTKEFTQKMEDAINQGTSASIVGNKFTIHTPLIGKTKDEIIQMGFKFHADYSYSISCYNGEEAPCLKCPACDIRSRAFKKLNIEDPLITRLKKEGKI